MSNSQNYDVHVVKDTKTEKGMASTFYSCRHFTTYEDGEIVLYGFNGSEDNVNIYVNEDNYEKVFVTNRYGKTIYKDSIQYH